MTCTRNNSYLLPEWFLVQLLRSDADTVLLTIIQPSIGCLGVILNASFIFVVMKNKAMHSTTNIYLSTLAIADLLYSTYTTCLHLIETNKTPFNRDRYFYGRLGCSLDPFLKNLGYYASLLLVNLVCFERYMAVCHPLFHRGITSKRRTVSLVIACWIVAAICSGFHGLASADFTVSCLYYPPGYQHLPNALGYCRGFFLESGWIGHLLFWMDFSLYSASVLGNVCIYNRIMYALGNRKGLENSNEDRMRKTRRQIARMLIINGVLFFFLHLATRTVDAIIYCNNTFKLYGWLLTDLDTAEWIGSVCVYLNSAINPIVYSLCNHRYRQAYADTFIPKCFNDGKDELVVSRPSKTLKNRVQNN